MAALLGLVCLDVSAASHIDGWAEYLRSSSVKRTRARRVGKAKAHDQPGQFWSLSSLPLCAPPGLDFSAHTLALRHTPTFGPSKSQTTCLDPRQDTEQGRDGLVRSQDKNPPACHTREACQTVVGFLLTSLTVAHRRLFRSPRPSSSPCRTRLNASTQAILRGQPIEPADSTSNQQVKLQNQQGVGPHRSQSRRRQRLGV